MAKILVVDDEPLVRRTIEAVLDDHNVVAVESGDEALDALRANTDIALIVCDILMPDMTGMELYGRAGLLRSGLQALFVFVTGGTLTAETQEFVARVENPVLRKPFTMDRLRGIVDQLT